MRTRSKLTLTMGLAIACALHTVSAQVTETDNTINLSSSYVGCDGLSTVPLRVMHNANYPIQWYTDSLLRMRLTETLTGQSVNGYTNLDLSGHLGIGNFNAPVYTPLTMVHLDSLGSETSGYRSYMGTGILMTALSDMMYVGLKRLTDDRINSVINWADNEDADSTYGPDALSFVFTSELDNTNAAGRQHGLEVARMIPASSGDEGFMGIGDYQTAGLQPTERLDALNGRVRIRQLPTDSMAGDSLLKFLVVDDLDSTSGEYGVVKWRHVPPGTGGGCEWHLLGAPGSNSNIATAYYGNPGCPQGSRMVGIGTNYPTAKLHVKTNAVTLGAPSVGVNVEVLGDSSQATGIGTSVRPELAPAKYQYGVSSTVFDATKANYGLSSTARIQTVANKESNNGVLGQATVASPGSAKLNRGGFFTASQGSNSSVATNIGSDNLVTGGNTAFGVQAKVNATDSTKTAYGVSGVANGASQLNYGLSGYATNPSASNATNYGAYTISSNGSTNYGTYAQAVAGNGTTNYGLKAVAMSGSINYGVYGSASGGTTNWAGYFTGNVNSTGTGYFVNGNLVASDAQFKTNIQPLEDPLSVIMQLQAHRYNLLTEEFPQMNFSSEEQVGLIAQELESVVPALVKDTRVEEVTDTLGAVISPAVEYKAVNYAGLVPYLIGAMQQQQATILQMQQQLDQCCATDHGRAGDGTNDALHTSTMENVQEQRLVITPNPFTDHTTLGYYVPQAGKVSLQFSTSDGKPMGTLREEQAETGAYTYEWNTSKLASGTYFCTFMLDGAVVVKRAVKVAR